MSFFAFGPDNMSRTQLEAFEHSCREWIESPPELTTPDLWESRRRTADTAADSEPERVATTDGVTTRPTAATPDPPARRQRRSVVDRMRHALLERSRGRVDAP